MWSHNITKSNLLHIPEEMKGVGGWEGTHFLIPNLLKMVQLKIQDVCPRAILTFYYYITTR